MPKWIVPLLLAFALGSLLFAQLGAQACPPALAAQEQARTPALQAAPQNVAATVPPGFTLSLFADGLALPTDMVFLPNGDLLVAEKGGYRQEAGTATVRLVRNGKVREQPVVVLGVNAEGDSGLLGLTIDPNFAANGYFYVWYATGANSIGWSGQPTDRLARLTYNPATGTADLASHLTVLEGVTWHEWHNGGGLAFGPDGLLYISTGDADIPEQARNPGTLNGKVLRIQPTDGGYAIPAGNPYVNVSGARPEVYAIGLRNPFRTFLHGGENTIYVADVGLRSWEEINRLDAPGLDFGWNLREGPCYLQSENCTPAAGLRDPFVSYRHDDGSTRSGAAIGGITAYTGSTFPAEYRNRIFFTDFTRQWLAVDDAGAANGLRVIGTRLGGINDMEQSRGALYLLDVERGAIWELRYTAGDNQAPSVALAVSAATGKPPFAVTARAEQVNDPDDVVLTYHWDFGDGAKLETEEPQANHTYTADGTYTLGLQVVDGRGAASTIVQERITVYSGEFPTITLENLITPGLEGRFRAGDAIRYNATRAAGMEGLRAEDPYLWSVELHHNVHKHPFLSDVPATTGVYTMPVESHGDTDIFYRFGLSMFTAGGQEIAVYRDLTPDLITMTLRAEPQAASLMWLDSGVQPAPAEVATIIGTQHSLEAADALVDGGNVYSFTHWVLDGSAPQTTRAVSITVGANPPAYVAHYLYARPADSLHLPIIDR